MKRHFFATRKQVLSALVGLGVMSFALSSCGSDAPLSPQAVAVVGSPWADAVVKSKAEYNSDSAWVRANISQMDMRIRQAKALNASLSRQIGKHNLSSSDFSAIKKDVKNKAKCLDVDMETVKRNMKLSKLSKADTTSLKKKYAALKAERHDLLRNLTLIARN